MKSDRHALRIVMVHSKIEKSESLISISFPFNQKAIPFFKYMRVH
jgi:hypothetical protein